MTPDNVKQRIEYLVTHGGLFPEEKTPAWRPWAVGLAVLMVVDIAVGLLR